MPAGKPLGLPIIPSAVASKLVGQLPAAKTVTPPIQRGRYTRNGQHPDVALINQMNEQTNQGVLYRTKEVFRAVGPVAASSTGALSNGIMTSSSAATARERWHFAFHTGKYTHALRAVACMVPQTSNSTVSSYATLTIRNGAGATVATANFYRGVDPGVGGAVSSGWQYLRPIEQFLTLSPDTDYYGTWSELNYGRLQSACVWELSSMTEKFSGYLPQNLASGSHIVDAYRENLVTLQYNLWRRSGATVMTWVADNGAWSSSSATPAGIATSTLTNIVDGSSTSISAATPGWTFDMTGKERVSQSSSGVPCVMKVLATKSASATLDGTVTLYNSSGVAVATIANQWNNAGNTWASTSFNMPVGSGKYDIMFKRDVAASTFNVYAIDIYEYES